MALPFTFPGKDHCVHTNPTPPARPSQASFLFRRTLAAFLTFWKTPSTLRTLLLGVLALQPLLLFLAARKHIDFSNYLVMNVVFIGFWRLAVFVYKKSFPPPPDA
ncbi:hypothetical protein [Megalodesulfovibrio paquesii]